MADDSRRATVHSPKESTSGRSAIVAALVSNTFATVVAASARYVPRVVTHSSVGKQEESEVVTLPARDRARPV